MSRKEKKIPAATDDAIRVLEQFWQVRLSEPFRALYKLRHTPILAPCEFFSLEGLASGEGREFGLLPQFLPFGRTIDEGGLYGFYITTPSIMENWPVLYWDEDEMFLRPVASDFCSFLRHCALTSRYEREEQWPGEAGPDLREAEMLLMAAGSPLPEHPAPRNAYELYQAHVAFDPQNAFSLCWLGCIRKAQGDEERALDLFCRASEAAPWSGDPCYLIGDIYCGREQFRKAVEEWWAVARRLLPLCTRTWEWDMGDEHPEADIYEVAADGLAQFSAEAPSSLKSDPLWRVVVYEDPYDPDAREKLGNLLLGQGNAEGAEREYLNALSLCCRETGPQPDRLYEKLIALYEVSGCPRDAALAGYDRRLDRSGR